MVNEIFCKRFKQLRLKKNLSQEELAKNLNVSQRTISGWEIGRVEPSMVKLYEIAKFFDVNIDYLFGFGTEDEFNILNSFIDELKNTNNEESKHYKTSIEKITNFIFNQKNIDELEKNELILLTTQFLNYFIKNKIIELLDIEPKKFKDMESIKTENDFFNYISNNTKKYLIKSLSELDNMKNKEVKGKDKDNE